MLPKLFSFIENLFLSLCPVTRRLVEKALLTSLSLNGNDMDADELLDKVMRNLPMVKDLFHSMQNEQTIKMLEGLPLEVYQESKNRVFTTLIFAMM